MDKDKLIEKITDIINSNFGDNNILKGSPEYAIKELTELLTSLTAPVPDGKVKRETVIMNKYIEKVGYGMDLFSECEIETITTILDILEDLTKTPDAG